VPGWYEYPAGTGFGTLVRYQPGIDPAVKLRAKGDRHRRNRYAAGVTADGKKITLGDSLRGARMAEQVPKIVRDACGLGNVATDQAASERATNNEEARSQAKEQARRIRRIALIASNLVGLAIAAYVLYQFRNLFLDLL